MNKLWKGRFKGSTHQLVDSFTASIRFDQRLYRYDIEGSIAHCRMLEHQGILAPEEADAIVAALGEILREIEHGGFEFDDSQEDVHMAIEQRLIDKVGEVGGKLHTGRSRNDQVALDMRLFLRDEIQAICEELQGLQRVLVAAAKANLGVIMPGFTHLQHAQPVLFSHHLMAYYEMFRRDRQRLLECLQRVNICPLGSGALAGTSLALDRHYTAEQLGFDAISANSMDAVADRDFIIEFTAAAALIMVHLSRMAEELVLWCSPEFAFIDIDDTFCTGSSIMPQKKNPDVPELVRGKCGRVIGNLVSGLTMMKGLPLTYNRDLQEDKEPLFDTVDTVRHCLQIMARLWEHIRVDRDRMCSMAAVGHTTATDLAEYLVTKGVSFRQAHHLVGTIVRHCLEKGKDLSELTPRELAGYHKTLADCGEGFLSVEKSVARRRLPGGTAPGRVREAIARAAEELQQ